MFSSDSFVQPKNHLVSLVPVTKALVGNGLPLSVAILGTAKVAQHKAMKAALVRSIAHLDAFRSVVRGCEVSLKVDLADNNAEKSLSPPP